MPMRASALLLAALAIVCAITGCSGKTRIEMARPPYVGVACSTPNSTACDRLGVAFWVKRSVPGARRAKVIATVLGKQTRLTYPAGEQDPRGLPFEGFLTSAGLQRAPLNLPEKWNGDPPNALPVRVRVTLPNGAS